jgi:hypothetical protein
MQINAVAHQLAAVGYSTGPQLPSGWHADWSSALPPLSDRDVGMLTAATGMTFNWPPKKDEGFPAAAVDLRSHTWGRGSRRRSGWSSPRRTSRSCTGRAFSTTSCSARRWTI